MGAFFSLLLLTLVHSCLFLIESESLEFVHNGFNDTNLTLDGATIIKPGGGLRLTNDSNNVIGHVFYPDPIQMFNSTSVNDSSFSTHFVFAIVPSDEEGGYGFAFTLSPYKEFPGAQGEHFLGVLNKSNDNSSSNHIFMVEFDTVTGHNKDSDTYGNHIGINRNSMESETAEPASYVVDGTRKKEDVELQSGHPIQAWIEYDGAKALVNVTIAPASLQTKPILPLISQQIRLSEFVEQKMYVGFSAATGGDKASSHYILAWSFRMNDVMAPPLNLSQLPIVPLGAEHKSSTLHPVKKALIATFSVVLFILLVALVSALVYRRRMRFEVLEEWELESPHRFQYRDLYKATKGFSASELLGVGGFGAVYKGVFNNTGAEVAVKKISNNSVQGIREFAAEIESLGRLRHKNLVNLQGWCKYKNDLLLVYDYIPNGSLDSLLYRKTNNVVLTWEQRFNIIKGVATGLLYLHEEWEKIVIHRDVKSSNVLIDRDLNARLGDFGLARLYEHGKHSHTTNVVGTIGYMAPELARIGKASTSSDVFAYGILLLEIACGRAPLSWDSDRQQVVLVDWVIEYLQMDRILDAVDPKLNSDYNAGEMELVMGLGLLCSHPKPEARPSMRQVLRYLNGDEVLPVFDKLNSVGSRAVEDTIAFSQAFSTDVISSASYASSSTAEFSTTFKSGR